MPQSLTQAFDFAQEKFSAALEHVRGRVGVFKASRKALIDVCQALVSQSCTELTFLVTGKSGEGKSTLINSLVGRKVCGTGDTLVATTETKLIEAGNINGVDVRIYDTQGVLDGEDEEDKIFESIRGKKIDILIVCVSMVGRAQSRDTKDTIALITKELGQDIWERAVIVLTQANERQKRNEDRCHTGLDSTGFCDVVTMFNDQLHEYLRKAKDAEGRPIPADTIEGVPVVPAGIYLEGQEDLRKLPDSDDWLSRLWLACFRRFKMEARKTFMGMSQDRLKLHNRNGKVQCFYDALVDNMLEREGERQESGEPISPSAVQPTSGHVKQLASNLAHLELPGPNAHSPVASQKRRENVSNRSSLSSPVSEASSMTGITKGISQEASHTTQKTLNTAALYTSRSEVAAEVRGEETRPSVSSGHVKQLTSNFAHLELPGPNAHSPVASQKRRENVSNRSSLSSPVSEASSMTDITKGISQEASHTTQKTLNTAALYTRRSEVAAEVRGEETRPSVSSGHVKQLASNFAHLELPGPNAHSPVASQKRRENVSNRSSLSSPVSEASSITDITKGISQEASHTTQKTLNSAALYTSHSEATAEVQEERTGSLPGQPSYVPGTEGHSLGAIHVTEDDIELGVMAESMLMGAACGGAVTGILGVGLMALAEAAEDGSVHQKVLRGTGAAVAAVTGAPGALVGGLFGAVVGGFRKLGKSVKKNRLRNER